MNDKSAYKVFVRPDGCRGMAFDPRRFVLYRILCVVWMGMVEEIMTDDANNIGEATEGQKAKTRPCRWFEGHDWIYLGINPAVYGKRGPFDPRTDEERTYMAKTYVFSQCGDNKEEPLQEF